MGFNSSQLGLLSLLVQAIKDGDPVMELGLNLLARANGLCMQGQSAKR